MTAAHDAQDMPPTANVASRVATPTGAGTAAASVGTTGHASAAAFSASATIASAAATGDCTVEVSLGSESVGALTSTNGSPGVKLAASTAAASWSSGTSRSR